MLNELINLNLFTFLVVFCRVGSAFTLLPGFGSQQVSLNVRLVFALAVSLVMVPMVKEYLPAEPKTMSVLVLLLTSEILIGVFLGMIPRIFMSALQTTGTLLSMLASLSTMFTMDAIAEQQSSVLSAFLSMLGITLIFATNTHHLMLAAIADSYTLFNPAQGLVLGDMSDFMAHAVSDSFRIGVQMSSPLIISGLSYYLGLGVLGRLMPQLPIFFFAMPIQVLLQIYLISITISTMMLVYLRFFQDGLYAFTGTEGLLFGQGL